MVGSPNLTCSMMSSSGRIATRTSSQALFDYYIRVSLFSAPPPLSFFFLSVSFHVVFFPTWGIPTQGREQLHLTLMPLVMIALRSKVSTQDAALR